MIRLLCANWNHADDAELERKHFPGVAFELCKSPIGASAPIPPELAKTADAVINYSGVANLSAKPDAFPRARIAVRHGVGFDNIDVVGFGALGVPVCNVPDYGTSEVADHAIALMLSLARGTTFHHEALRADPKAGWRPRAAPLVLRLRTATFGVIGLGRIGLAAARRAEAFGMRVVFFDPYRPNGTELSVGYGRVKSLEELMGMSDVVSVHAPLSAETHHMIGAKSLAAAKKGAIVVNTARGGVGDQADGHRQDRCRSRDPVGDDPVVEVDQGDRHEHRGERQAERDVVSAVTEQDDRRGKHRAGQLDDRVARRDLGPARAAAPAQQQPADHRHVVVGADRRAAARAA